jgi:prepilin-type N-terminal cleavage/methylation domain-containing protein
MKARGFSLVELSIVILIISFIMAAIAVGSNITDNAKSRQAIKALTDYRAAFIQFREQFNALPGDFNNAATIWGNTTSGNGDGIITCTVNGDECWTAFQHLSLAGYVAGNYNGNNQGPILITNGTPMVIQTYNTSLYNYAKVHVIGNWGNSYTVNSTQIDTKMDDGTPTFGDIASTSATKIVSPPSCIKQSDQVTDVAYNYTGMGVYYLSNLTNPCQTMGVIY